MLTTNITYLLTLGACARVTVLALSLTLGACARVTVLGLSFAVHRAAENSDHFYALVKLWHDKHRNGLQFDSWILLKCFHSRVMADSP